MTAGVPRVAAVDVGTNSVRLLVAEPGSPLRQLARDMTITRLGAGVDATGRLDDAALARTLNCLERYAARWRSLGADRVGVTATSAVRDAEDRDRFFDGVRARTGVRARVLTGDEEAAMAFRGVRSTLDVDGEVLVLDIGGGSTELILGRTSPRATISRQLGCVRLTERCLHDDPPTQAQLAAAVRAVDAELDEAACVVDAAGASAIVGVAGTVTTVGALHLGLESYQPEHIHGTRVPAAAVREIRASLAGMTAARRAELGPMAKGREDVIVAGVLILERTMDRFGFREVIVSESDILDGLALELLDAAR